MSSAANLGGSPFARARFGAAAVLRGPQLALQHRDLAVLCLVTAALYTAVWVLVLWQAATWDQDVARWLVPPQGPRWFEVALQAVARTAAYVLVWLFALALAGPLALPMCGPLFSLLAERTVLAITGDAAPTLSWRLVIGETVRSAVRGMVISLGQLAGVVLIGTLAFGAGLLVPPLGAVLSATLMPCWNGLGMAAMAMSFALDNHRCTLAEQLRVVQEQRAVMVGFGLAAQALAWLPLLMPVVVVAASALVMELRATGAVRFAEPEPHQGQPS